MLAWQVWLIIAGVCLVIEIATVGFLVFWFAVAALITALLSLFIHNVIAQTVIFILTSVILILLTKPLTNKITKKDVAVTNSNTVIGKEPITVGSTVKILRIDGVKLVIDPINIKSNEEATK